MIQAMLVMMCLLAAPSTGAPSPPTGLNLDPIRALPLQHDGRWPPLDTVARDLVEEVTGDPFFQDRDPVVWLLAWTFDPATWMQQPLITIGNAELRRELRLSPTKTVYSYAELAAHDHFVHLVEQLRFIEKGRKMNPLESKVAGINKKLGVFDKVFAGAAIRILPDPSDADGAWKRIPRITGGASEDIKVVAGIWSDLRDTFMQSDSVGFGAASRKLVDAAAALPAAFRPARKLIETELHYNAIRPYRKAWVAMVIGAVLAACAMLVKRRWFDTLATLGLVTGFVLLTYGMWLR